MRGQWSSQTRRMNRHYQTGDGGDFYQRSVRPGTAAMSPGILRCITNDNMRAQGDPWRSWEKWDLNITLVPTLVEQQSITTVPWYLRQIIVYLNRDGVPGSPIILNESHTTAQTGQPFTAGTASQVYYGEPLQGNIYTKQIVIPSQYYSPTGRFSLTIQVTFYAAGAWDMQDTGGYDIIVKEGV